MNTHRILIAAVTLMSIHAALLGWAAWRDAPTYDEVAYLPAGVSHWELGRFELGRVSPPLVRMIAAAPLMFAGVETDWRRIHDEPGSKAEHPVGRDFLTANGPRSFRLFTLARWACIPLSLIGGAVCLVWARRLFGDAAGLLALALWCFCPNILGHGH